MSEVVAVAKLRAFIERVERIEADIAEMNADKSDVYKEIRGEGFDVKTVRKIVSKRKLDTNERQDQDALFDLYWDALHGEGRAPAHARENIEEIGAELPAHDADGVIIEDQPETANEVPAQDGGGTVAGGFGKCPHGKSNAARPASVDAHVNDGRLAGQARNEVVTGGESAATNSLSAPPSPRAADTGAVVSSSAAAAPVPNSHSSEPTSSQAETKTGADILLPSVPVTSPTGPQIPAVPGGEPSIPSIDAGGEKMDEAATSPGRSDEQSGLIYAQSKQAAAQFNNPRCQHPATCHFANSRDACHDCLMAWAQRPKEEQIRLWKEANEAARAEG